MAFPTFTIGDTTYTPNGVGRYMASDVAFGGPLSYFKLSAGTFNKRTGLTSAAVTRYLELDIENGGDTVRRGGMVQSVIQVPQGFTVGQIDLLAGDLSEFLTPERLTVILMGGN